MRVIVDADACPRGCLELVQQQAVRHNFEVITVASFNHQIANAHHIVVGDEPQAADIAVANQTQAGDIVVTQDWGLAALALGKGARAISPQGRIYTAEKMDFLLEERNLLARFRKGGGRTKGPAKRSGLDEQRFAAGFLALVSADAEAGKSNL